MSVKEVAERMMNPNTDERQTAEAMMGVRFEQMTQEQRVLAAECIAAFCE